MCLLYFIDCREEGSDSHSQSWTSTRRYALAVFMAQPMPTVHGKLPQAVEQDS